MELDQAKVQECILQLEKDAPDYTNEIPAPVLDALHRYVATGAPTGHFLNAVLNNDLFDAVARADESSLKALRALVQYIYNHLPGNCWGPKYVSGSAVADWRKAQGLVGMEMSKCTATSTSTTSSGYGDRT